MNFLQAANYYVARGFRVFPLKPGSKEPATKNGVHDATANMYVLEEYARKVPDANIAVGCGPDSGMTGKHGALPACPMSSTPQGGFHLFFRHHPDGGNSQNLLGQGIDVKSAGGYVVLPPSYWDGRKRGEKVAEGGNYKWERPPLGSIFPAMPTWVLARLKPKSLPVLTAKPWDRSNADLVNVAKALEFVSNHDYTAWIMVGMALKAQFGDAAFDLWNSWSASGYPDHDSRECQRKWASFKRTTGVSLGSIFHEARIGGADLKQILCESRGLS
jgi:hypothetical protein